MRFAAPGPPTMGPMDVTIVEVSPRDGLQNEPVVLSTEAKVELIGRLVEAGARRVEAVSFAHPRLVPAMADAEAVMERVPRADGGRLRRAGAQPARPRPGPGAGVDEVNMVVCVSETFNRRNQNASTEESMQAAADVLGRAREAGAVHHPHPGHLVRLPVRGRGRPRAGGPSWRPGGRPPGAQELCLADTIGVGVPSQVRDLAARVRDAVRPLGRRCASTSTTPATPASPTPWPPSSWGRRCWTPAPAGSAAARSPPRRPATSPPTTWCTCWSGWACTPATTWRRCCPRPPS
jgi:isopropylmalate/homocitrate/citramalate synthase